MNVFERFREAWHVFRGRDHPGNITQFTPGYGTGQIGPWFSGPSSSDRPDRYRAKPGNERTLINSVFNRIALDVAAVEFHHAYIDENESFTDIIKDDLEDLMNVEANIDQTSMAYTVDLVMSMFDEGVIAEVPVVCERKEDGEFKSVDELRLGKITEWRPEEIKVNLYNQMTGQKEDVVMMKREVSIIENPFFSVMNQKNSIFQRLQRKLAVLDAVDEKFTNDKLNMIIQLPYIVRTDAQRTAARNRLKEMEGQLAESKLGITYTDGTEKIVQLNRPLENNLQSQIEWLTELFFSLMFITKEIMNGTADEKAMTNYMNRTVGTICDAICAERRRKWLTKKQREKMESIVYTQDPFRLIPVTQIADIGDKMTRNAILSPNEVRGMIGYKPSDDPTSDQLVNRNMPVDQTPGAGGEADAPMDGAVQEPLDQLQQSAISPPMNRAQRRRMEREKNKIRGSG